MIKEINLENFQSHKKTKIELSPGINVITGQSDSGKSSIIRALNWIVFNRPTGEDFIRNGEDECKVKIETDTDNISRIKKRKNKKNCYLLNEQELKAIGQDVPNEIKSSINLNEVNLQNQFDSPFLISETPGKITETLNRISNLEEVDKAINNINSFIRNENDKITITREEINKNTEELSKFSNIKDLEDKISRIEIKQEKLQKKKEKNKNLSFILDEFKNLSYTFSCKQNQLDKVKKFLVKINENTEKIKKLFFKQEKKYRIEYVLKKYKETQEKHSFSSKKHKSVIKYKKTIEMLLKRIETNKNKFLEINKFKISISSLEKIIFDLKNITEQRIISKKQFDKIKPETCPLCGKNW